VSEELRRQIATLHSSLQRLDADRVDANTRASLMLLLGDVTRLLGGETVSEEDPITDRLETLAVQFEAEHPAVGVAVRQLVDALAKAGI
jgi:Domain of unknown function (DUF4404)